MDLHRADRHRRGRFRELHGRIIAARLVVRNDQATLERLDEITGGGYSAAAGRAACPSPGR